MPSNTALEGRFALRVALTNHRTRSGDLDALVEVAARCARELEREGEQEERDDRSGDRFSDHLSVAEH